jgi:hypothetical protein
LRPKSSEKQDALSGTFTAPLTDDGPAFHLGGRRDDHERRIRTSLINAIVTLK